MITVGLIVFVSFLIRSYERFKGSTLNHLTPLFKIIHRYESTYPVTKVRTDRPIYINKLRSSNLFIIGILALFCMHINMFLTLKHNHHLKYQPRIKARV